MVKLVQFHGREKGGSLALADSIKNESGQAPFKAGIIGGLGQFGQWWTRLLEGRGFPVAVSDVSTPMSNRDLVKGCDVILLSIPMQAVTGVVTEISDALSPNKLLIDLASVKTPFVQPLLATQAEILSLHLMFAPSVPSAEGQSCVVCRQRPGQYTQYFVSLLEEIGIRCVSRTPEEHDKAMAVVQGLTHFQAITAAHALVLLGVNPGETLQLASPVYRMRLAMIGRILAQDPALYGEIQTLNPYVPAVLETLQASAQLFQDAVKEHDLERFMSEFNGVKSALGDFTKDALAESTKWIAALAAHTSKE
jgi:prephenate dehydrogenase